MIYELVAINGRRIEYRQVYRNIGNAIEEAKNISKHYDQVLVNKMSNSQTVYMTGKRYN